MKKYPAIAAVLIALGALLASAPAFSHGSVQFSAGVVAPGYYYPYSQPGVIIYPQSQYIYGAPPSAFYPTPYASAPQPALVPQPGLVPPPVIYVQPDHRFPPGHSRPWRDGRW